MFYLIVILAITLASLIVVLWGGTYFFQGYIYTEPSAGIFWQAPVVAAGLTLGFAVWCFSVALSNAASPTNIPINTIFNFSDQETMLRRPAYKIWAISLDPNKKDEQPVEYVSIRVPGRLNRDTFQYFHDPYGSDKHPWLPAGIGAIEMQATKEDPTKKRFVEVPPDQGLFGGKLDLVDTKQLQYRQFRSDDGWVMQEFEEGPTGLPFKRSWGRFLLNIFFNLAHFAAWFVGLWLILRYQWLHALGFAVVMWLAVTLLILPMMLGYAGEISEARRTVTAQLSFSLHG